uniref:Uncharacterized protein n=1 Tax=Pipistrellus kuhlii TaxID=59472 RepID=A0A7J7X057_PIPKU|nr:hypothetical protein mPipKuh1_010725 [Pipistrellus kuhlii]
MKVFLKHTLSLYFSLKVWSLNQHHPHYLDISFHIYILIDFTQRGIERDRELETSMREKHRPAASCTPPTGDVPATNVHALDWNRTRDLSVRRPTLYPLSQTGFSYLDISNANFHCPTPLIYLH